MILCHMAKIGVTKTKYVYVNVNDGDVTEAVYNTIFWESRLFPLSIKDLSPHYPALHPVIFLSSASAVITLYIINSHYWLKHKLLLHCDDDDKAPATTHKY